VNRARSRAALCGRIALAVALIGLGGCTLPRWPVAGPLISPFGLRWNGGPDLHRGVDVRAAEGTPVHAMKPGRVRFAGTMRGFGNVIWIDHDDQLLTVYAHLSRIDVSEGQNVDRSEPIGLVGQTGNASGPHLHFEVWQRGREVDPVPLLGGFPPTGP